MEKQKIQITDPRVVAAIEAYKSGKAVKTVLKEFKLAETTLVPFLKELGIKRSCSQAGHLSKGGGIVRDDALDVLTSEALYWIGFLYADGHIDKDRPRISLTLSEADKSHLVKFADFFGTGLTMRLAAEKELKSNGYTSNRAFRVAFSSQKIHDKLVSLGFTSRKTWTVEPPQEILKNSRDFWRGMLDGDGWIYLKKYKGKERYASLGLCGQEITLVEFLSFLDKSGVHTKVKPYKSKRREFLWQFDIHCNKAIAAARVLYHNSTVYLDRKYEKYLSWVTEKINDSSPTSILPRDE